MNLQMDKQLKKNWKFMDCCDHVTDSPKDGIWTVKSCGLWRLKIWILLWVTRVFWARKGCVVAQNVSVNDF